MSTFTYKEETGNKYGFLTVIKNVGKNKQGEYLWECQCDCGNKTIVSGSSLRSDHTVSCGCFQKDKISQINIKNEIGNTYGRLTVIEYMGSKDNNAIWKCKCECGNECIVKGIHLRYGDTMSCGCLNSKGEAIIKTILNERNINYIPQKTFNDCRDINPLPFDFYLPDYNACIEYDGIQHYEPVDLFGGIEAFGKTKIHDNIKNLYCQQNGILLLRIKYDQDILMTIDIFLNEIKEQYNGKS